MEWSGVEWSCVDCHSFFLYFSFFLLFSFLFFHLSLVAILVWLPSSSLFFFLKRGADKSGCTSGYSLVGADTGYTGYMVSTSLDCNCGRT